MSETTPIYVIAAGDVNVVDLDTPTYGDMTQDFKPTPAITDEHMLFLKGLRGHAWISDYFDCTEVQAEQYLSDIIAFVEDERRARGWL